MKYDEEEYDKTKYFLTPDRKKIYALKGQNHKSLGYNILEGTGLSTLYYHRYEEYVPVAIFLTYCGYVLVDEGEEKVELGLFEDDKITKFTAVGYCSVAIDEEYVEYLRRTYGENPDNILDDVYETKNERTKNMIDKIIKEVRERQKENQRDDEIVKV